MISSYQMTETHLGDLSLSVHERIDDLHRSAGRLARAVAESAMDSGCTDQTHASYDLLGPRQRQAWDMIAEAHSWNAISDNAEELAKAEGFEREGVQYQAEYNSGDGFQVAPTQRITTKGGRTGYRAGRNDLRGNPYVQFDDGSFYAVPEENLQAGESAEHEHYRQLADKYDPDGSHNLREPGFWSVQIFGADGWHTTLNTADAGEARFELFNVVIKDQGRHTVRVVPPAPESTAWPEGKTFGELTPAQRAAAIKSAAGKFQAELTASAPALGKVLDDFELGRIPGAVLTGDEIAGCRAMGANPTVVSAIVLRDAPKPDGEYIELGPEAVEKFALAKKIADDLERREATSPEPVHVRTPGKAYDRQGRHTGPGQWLSLIHEANRISPEMFGQPECSSQPEGWTEEYPDARVIHRSDESVSVISKTAHGSEVLAEAARRLGL